MRHAKSDWSQDLEDFDRPLNGRGQKTAPAMGRWMSRQGYMPDRIYCSAACRARETVLGLIEPLQYPQQKILWMKELYLVSAAEMLNMIENWFTEVQSLMIVAHNPGLENLVAELAPPEQLTFYDDHFPTAAFAHFEFHGEGAVDLNSGILQCMQFPRDLDD